MTFCVVLALEKCLFGCSMKIRCCCWNRKDQKMNGLLSSRKSWSRSTGQWTSWKLRKGDGGNYILQYNKKWSLEFLGWLVPCICSVGTFSFTINEGLWSKDKGKWFQCGRSVCTIPWRKCCLQDTLLQSELFLVHQEWAWALFLELQSVRPWIFYQWMLKSFTKIGKVLIVTFSQNLKWL